MQIICIWTSKPIHEGDFNESHKECDILMSYRHAYRLDRCDWFGTQWELKYMPQAMTRTKDFGLF